MSGKFVRPVVPDKFVKFRDPRLNHSGEILPKAIGGGIFDRFYRDNFQLTSWHGISKQYVGVDAHVKFGDYVILSQTVIEM